MLSGVCVGSNNLEKSGAFYDQVLATIGMERRVSEENEIGYGQKGEEVTFWVLKPFNGETATFGNGTQVMFSTGSHDEVHAFHETALLSGGKDEGAPGPREYSEDYYGAYVRDLDGNKLHIAVNSQI